MASQSKDFIGDALNQRLNPQKGDPLGDRLNQILGQKLGFFTSTPMTTDKTLKGDFQAVKERFGPVNYTAPQQQATAIQAIPEAPKEAQGREKPDWALDVPEDWRQGLKTAYERYPEVPRGFIEAIANQESTMGKNPANKDKNWGEYGYIGGILGPGRGGRYEDMLKNSEKGIEYAIFQGAEAIDKDLKTPSDALNVITSIVAQHIRERYDGRSDLNAEEMFDLYNRYYKSLKGHSLKPEQKKRFIDAIEYYAGEQY